MPDEKTKTEAAPIVPPPFAKAKSGDHVTYFDGDAMTSRGAILAHVDTNGVAALKIPLPASRKGGGGGVALVKGAKFTEKPAKGCWGMP